MKNFTLYIYLVLTLTLLPFGLGAQATDLIISEYVEGSGNNKYVEIYNGTGASVNLGDYRLRLYANGAAAPTNDVLLTGTLLNGAVIVYKNSASTIYAGATTNSAAVNFNGDDAVALFKVSTNAFVDIFGVIGCDPGASWTTGGNTTLDRTLVRNANVCSGITTSPATGPCTFTTLGSEWTQSGIDVVSNLGSHTMTCVACTPVTAPTNPATAFSATPGCNSATINFTQGNGANRIVVISTTSFSNIPANSTAYTANTAFGSGSQVGAGNYTILNGTGNSVNVTNLSPNTTYFVKVFEYNGTTANCTESYLTAGVTSFSFSTQVAAAPTVLASSVNAVPACYSAAVTLMAGNGTNRIVVVSASNFPDTPVNGTNYTANAAFGSGNQIGAGNYVVFKGNGNSVNVTNLAPNTTYFVKVFEYNGTTTNCNESYLTAGVTSYSFTTPNNCATPQIRSILVNACGLGSDEGLNEYILVQNGSSPLSFADLTITFNTAGTYCNSGCGGNTLVHNTTFINQLNTTAGCALFQDADPIPANANIIIFTGLNPNYPYDFSSQCPGTTPFYAIFCNNASGAGRFVNSGAGGSTLTINFTSSTDAVTYAPNSIGSDGGFVDFDASGNPTYRLEPGCIYPLGVEIAYFKASKTNEGVNLEWRTLSEENADYFTIERSGSDIGFSDLGKVECAGNSQQAIDYSFTDRDPLTGINYYRLQQFDRDGKSSYSGVIAINNAFGSSQVSYLSDAGIVLFNEELPEGTLVELFDLNGKCFYSEKTASRTSSVNVALPSGMWMVRTDSGITGKVAAY